MSFSDLPDAAREEMIEEMERTETGVFFGPFDPPEYCDFEYGGIETLCGDDATHKLTFELDDVTDELVRCDEHGFPWVVRTRREQQLGHPLCQVCQHREFTGFISPNDPVGTAKMLYKDGEERETYVCEECADEYDLDLDPL
ncbi:hypothetical protein HUG10_20785 (plasmid) [Halorarum halophilum]|uniref:Uncharacterized protein n=1 Tax=Halorarum halophilum TaxID=2743090 RepID=A0A7D5K3Z4_9EURY|nr:hypothetical protein [Halobaculum halophilum]QLG30041.1 hypothetical protein HUG10_20785 [Halobaculum halophilum]